MIQWIRAKHFLERIHHEREKILLLNDILHTLIEVVSAQLCVCRDFLCQIGCKIEVQLIYEPILKTKHW